MAQLEEALEDRRACTECGKYILVNKDGSLRNHKTSGGNCIGGRPSSGHSGVASKAEAYIAQGRVHISGDDIILVSGSRPEPYVVKWTGITWSCNCEARIWKCTHVVCALILRPELQPKADLSGDDADPEIDALLGVTRTELEASLKKSVETSKELSSAELDKLLK